MAHLFGKKERIYDERKQNFKITLEKLLANYSRMFVVELDNVTSNQMHQVCRFSSSRQLSRPRHLPAAERRFAPHT